MQVLLGAEAPGETLCADMLNRDFPGGPAAILVLLLEALSESYLQSGI